MQTKTAMQQFINWYTEFTKNGNMPSKEEVLWQATEFRDTVEREQIEAAWDACEDFCTDWDNNAVYGSGITHPNKEQYFSKTFPK